MISNRIIFCLISFWLVTSDTMCQSQLDKLIHKGKFDQVIEHYQELDENDKTTDSELNYYVGVSLYNTPEKKQESLQYFKTYIEANSQDEIVQSGNELAFYLLAKMYHLNYNFELAEETYNQFLDIVRNNQNIPKKEVRELLKKVEREIEQCQNGRIAVNNPRKVTIENLGDTINTKYPEYAGVISQDEKKILFTSRRPKNPKEELEKEHFEDIYSADLDKGSLFENDYVYNSSQANNFPDLVTDFSYSNLKRLDHNVNSKDHEGSIQLHNNDSVLFFFKNSDIWSVNIYSEEKPVKLDVYINSDQHEPSVFFSYDNTKLFVVSDKPGGYGGLDIYMSEKSENGNWGELTNLGPNVNTEYDEDAPYLDPNNKTFYFSSQGHSSIGEFDIFRCQIENGAPSFPVNIGFPVNTPANDIYFTMTKRYNRGYYSSSQLNGNGGMDIYRISFADERDPVAELKGRIYTDIGDFVPRSNLTLKAIETGEIIIKESDSDDGSYFFLLGYGKSYKMIVETEGFLPYERLFSIPNHEEYFRLYQEVHHVYLKDTNGEVIGQQTTLYNSTGDETEKPKEFISVKDQEEIGRIKDTEQITSEISCHNDVKFYMSEEELDSLVLDSPSIEFEFSDSSSVYFIKGDDFAKSKQDSYTLSGRTKFTSYPSIATDPELNPINQLIFTVQVGLFSKELVELEDVWLDHNVFLRKKDEFSSYNSGMYLSYQEAKAHCDFLLESEVSGAFVTAYLNGERIDINKALSHFGQ